MKISSLAWWRDSKKYFLIYFIAFIVTLPFGFLYLILKNQALIGNRPQLVLLFLCVGVIPAFIIWVFLERRLFKSQLVHMISKEDDVFVYAPIKMNKPYLFPPYNETGTAGNYFNFEYPKTAQSHITFRIAEVYGK